MPATLFTPVTTADRPDGKLSHLDGLKLSRACCFRSLAGARPGHLAAGLPHVVGDYLSEHWLARFAVLALEA